jgi:hypothetical protein
VSLFASHNIFLIVDTRNAASSQSPWQKQSLSCVQVHHVHVVRVIGEAMPFAPPERHACSDWCIWFEVKPTSKIWAKFLLAHVLAKAGRKN